MLEDIQAHLIRVGAYEVEIEDDEFHPELGVLLRVALEHVEFRLPRELFLRLLEEMPDGAGGVGVKLAIEREEHRAAFGVEPELLHESTAPRPMCECLSSLTMKRQTASGSGDRRPVGRNAGTKRGG